MRLFCCYVSQKAIEHGFASCPIKSINAEHPDNLVRAAPLDRLGQPDLANQPRITRDRWVRKVIIRAEFSPDRLLIELSPDGRQLVAEQEFEKITDAQLHPSCVYKPDFQRHGDCLTLHVGIQIKRLDGRRIILAPDGSDLLCAARQLDWGLQASQLDLLADQPS